MFEMASYNRAGEHAVHSRIGSEFEQKISNRQLLFGMDRNIKSTTS